MWYARLAICGQRFRRAPAGDNDSSRPGKQSGLRVSGIARRRTEPGWRAAVLDERASRHALRLRGSEEGSGSRAPASASGASMPKEGAEAFFPLRATTTAADLDVRAADLQEEMAEQRFSVPSAPTKTAATQRTSQRAERAIENSAMREQPKRGLQVRGDTTIPRVPGPTWTPSTALTSEITTSPTCTRPLSRSTSRRAPSRLSR